MMDSTALVLLALLGSCTIHQAWSSDSESIIEERDSGRIIFSYGETITVPCYPEGAQVANDLLFVKWKYDNNDGAPVDLLIKQPTSEQATVLQPTNMYAPRVSLDPRHSLLIANASLSDQRTFTCMEVSASNLREHSTTVAVHKEPTVQIVGKTKALLQHKPVTVAKCVAADANPPPAIVWKKNGKALEADGKAVVITPGLKVNPATGLSTTSSTLQYTATYEDEGAVFSCVSANQETDPAAFELVAEGKKPANHITLTHDHHGSINKGLTKARADDAIFSSGGSDKKEPQGESKLVVGLVATGLLLTAAMVGLVHVLYYVRNSRLSRTKEEQAALTSQYERKNLENVWKHGNIWTACDEENQLKKYPCGMKPNLR